MREQPVKTSVIGSYPIKPDNLEIIKSFFNHKRINWRPYIEEAVNDMVKANIELISDGQTRDPFVTIFTRKIKGCRVRARTEIIDQLKFEKPITVDDQKLVRKMIPSDKQLIGVLTGPYTLGRSCINSYYKDEKTLMFDFAEILNKEAKMLEKHVDMLSIDEPFFSNSFPDYAVELIKTVVKDISCPTRLHICGDVSTIIPGILSMPVDILSHEFKASPKLFHAFREHIDDLQQRICLGSVRSDSIKVETVEEIVKHIEKGIEVFHDSICQIAPDCGLRMMPRKIAFNKLRNLVKARDIVYGG